MRPDLEMHWPKKSKNMVNFWILTLNQVDYLKKIEKNGLKNWKMILKILID